MLLLRQPRVLRITSTLTIKILPWLLQGILASRVRTSRRLQLVFWQLMAFVCTFIHVSSLSQRSRLLSATSRLPQVSCLLQATTLRLTTAIRFTTITVVRLLTRQQLRFLQTSHALILLTSSLWTLKRAWRRA